MPRIPSRLFALSTAVVAVALVSAATSCGDPTAIKAQFETDSAKVEVFALNGTAPTLPSAIRTRSIVPVRVGNDFATSGRLTELVGWADDGGDAGGDVVRRHAFSRLAVDHEAVAPENHGCIDPLALAQRRNQIANVRH